MHEQVSISPVIITRSFYNIVTENKLQFNPTHCFKQNEAMFIVIFTLAFIMFSLIFVISSLVYLKLKARNDFFIGILTSGSVISSFVFLLVQLGSRTFDVVQIGFYLALIAALQLIHQELKFVTAYFTLIKS